MELFTWPFVISVAFLIFVTAYLFRSNNANSFKKMPSFSGAISRFTIDLTQLAQQNKLDPVVSRDNEIKRVIQVLSRRKKNNIILFGKAGIGKTAIAEGLAIAIATRKVPHSLSNKVVLKLDISSVLAGTKYRGEFEERFKALMDQIIAMNKQIIVFIDEIHTIVQAGGAEGAIDADDIIKAPLARGELQMIGTTTEKEYKQYIATDPALNRRFEALFVEEPTKVKTVSMLRALRKSYEDYHNVVITDEIVKQIIEQSAKIKDRVFPDKAIDIMDEVSAKVRLDNIDSDKQIEITVKDLKEVLKGFI